MAGAAILACEKLNQSMGESHSSIGADHLHENRFLTEIDRLLRSRRPDGSYPEGVREGTHLNLVTKTKEDAMPGAVSEVVQPLAEIIDQNGQRRRTFIWKGIGKCAVSVSESGYEYHETEPAFRRVAVEVNEAKRNEEKLSPGVWQTMLSPKMSRADASVEVAKREHLYDDDAVRTSKAVLDSEGNVVGRLTKSLLVRDVPLEAWVAMLKDPNNVFGKAFEIKNEQSALSIMELFNQLDMPEADLPEGPVTIVEGVIPYIEDPVARASVSMQVDKFRTDQRRLHAEAELAADEWLKFEMALAESLFQGIATHEIKQFIISMSEKWNKETLQLIQANQLGGGAGFKMTRSLAARLEEAKQQLLARRTKILIGDEEALLEVGLAKAEALRREAETIRFMEITGYSPAEIAWHQAMLNHWLASSNISVGAGCGGLIQGQFNSSDNTLPPEAQSQASSNREAGEGVGNVHDGVCRTPGCPTNQAPTRVGGCNVCLKFCQPLWNQGINPEGVYAKDSQVGVAREELRPSLGSGLVLLDVIKVSEIIPAEAPKEPLPNSKQELALAG